jgi:hypothetical protein
MYLLVHRALSKQHVMEYDHIYQRYVDRHLIEEDQVLKRIEFDLMIDEFNFYHDHILEHLQHQ